MKESLDTAWAAVKTNAPYNQCKAYFVTGSLLWQNCCSRSFWRDCFRPFPELPQSEHISVADATWLALNVVSGGGNASNSQPIGVTKIAKSVIAPLADHNISVFMLSTYQTDFILVSVDNNVPVLLLFDFKRLCRTFFYFGTTSTLSAADTKSESLSVQLESRSYVFKSQ